MPPVPEVREPGPVDAVQHWLRYDAALATTLTRRGVRAATALAVGGVLRPVSTVRDTLATAGSVYRTVRPIYETASPLMKSRTLRRELAVHTVPLRELKEAGHRAGGSLNDAFMAGVTGALRR
jgi:hypothetical protein